VASKYNKLKYKIDFYGGISEQSKTKNLKCRKLEKIYDCSWNKRLTSKKQMRAMSTIKDQMPQFQQTMRFSKYILFCLHHSQ
jgi:hypothetical protein